MIAFFLMSAALAAPVTVTSVYDGDTFTLSDGSKMAVPKIYPLDAMYDTPDDVPEDVKSNKRYAGVGGYTISEVAEKVASDYGKIDILVHSLANAPEVNSGLVMEMSSTCVSLGLTTKSPYYLNTTPYVYATP